MKNIIYNFIDIIFPARCLVCEDFLEEKSHETGWYDKAICESCQSDFITIGSPLCPICGRPFQNGIIEDHLCESCLRKHPFYNQARAPYMYEGALMRAIHRLKYEGRTRIANVMGPQLASFVARRFGERDSNWVVMPVPLHLKKLRKRGFNQALLLARHVSVRLKSELDFFTLRRTRDTKPQTGLKSKERRKNVRQAFDVVNSRKIKNRNVILIDDVATTGSTMNECARVLKRAKAGKVFCISLARTPITKEG